MNVINSKKMLNLRRKPFLRQFANLGKSEMLFECLEIFCWIEFASSLLYVIKFHDLWLDCTSEPKFTYLINFLG